MIRDYQAIHQTWFEHGKQRIIKTFGKHRKVKLVGYLDYETGEVYCEEHDPMMQRHFSSLPPYNPNLNLIEWLWKWLKEKVIYNVFYKTGPEIRKNINAFLKTISADPETVIQRLCYKL